MNQSTNNLSRLPGPLDPRAPGLSHVSFACLPDATLIALGRNLTTIADVDAFEQSAGRPIPGLYPALFEGGLHQALVQPMAYLNVQQGGRGAPVVPDASMRFIVRNEAAPVFADAWVINSKPIYSWRDVDEVNFRFWRLIAAKPRYKNLPLIRSIHRESERRDLNSLSNLAMKTPNLLDDIWNYLDLSPAEQLTHRREGKVSQMLVPLQRHVDGLTREAQSAQKRYLWNEEVCHAACELQRALVELPHELYRDNNLEQAWQACDAINQSVFRIGIALDKLQPREPWALTS